MSTFPLAIQCSPGSFSQRHYIRKRNQRDTHRKGGSQITLVCRWHDPICRKIKRLSQLGDSCFLLRTWGSWKTLEIKLNIKMLLIEAINDLMDVVMGDSVTQFSELILVWGWFTITKLGQGNLKLKEGGWEAVETRIWWYRAPASTSRTLSGAQFHLSAPAHREQKVNFKCLDLKTREC